MKLGACTGEGLEKVLSDHNVTEPSVTTEPSLTAFELLAPPADGTEIDCARDSANASCISISISASIAI